jgi:hypothetical protein
MIEFLLPGSRSLIAQATHIFYVQVLAAQPGSWLAERPPAEKRVVQVSLRIERVFKGKGRAGDTVKVAIDQWRSAIGRILKLPGAWSSKPLDPGTRYLVFASVEGPDLALLRDPAVVLSEAEALADVELAHVEDAERLPVSAVLEKALAAPAKVGFLFPDYVLERHGALLLAVPREFEPLARLLEAPTLGNAARNSLLQGIGAAMDQGEATAAVEDRYIRALFHLMQTPEAAPFGDNIVGVYLPNRTARRPAWQVFHRASEERRRAQRTLTGRRGVDAETLLVWLLREPEKKTD